MRTLDASIGEGGGQVLRTALSLAASLGEPVRLVGIRSARPRPGLMRQHLASVRAAAAVTGAEVEGDALGSRELTFRPGPVRPGAYAFSVGSSGSACLVLQTVLPPLLTAPGPATLVIEGGTHNPMAPPFDFLVRAFLPLLERMGPRVEAVCERPGFHPAGGGLLRVRVEPVPRLRPIEILERGRLRGAEARAVVAGLPLHIADRELDVVRRRLRVEPQRLEVEALPPSRGPANVLVLALPCEHVTEVFTGFGRPGLPAEAVAGGVVREAERWRRAAVPAGEHLADQLLLPMALAGGGRFRTLAPSSHATTNAEVIRFFLDLPIAFEETEPGTCEVRVGAAGSG